MIYSFMRRQIKKCLTEMAVPNPFVIDDTNGVYISGEM